MFIGVYLRLFGKFCCILREKFLPYESMPANFCLVCKKICSKIRIYFLRTQALRITFEIMCTSEKSGVHFLWGDSGKYRAGTERTGVVGVVRLLQLSAAGEVFLEGTCPLSRCPQTAKFPVPMLLGTGRRWVRKATAFRGRSEQDRSALCPACCALILETFRWNVSNGICLNAKLMDTAQPVPTDMSGDGAFSRNPLDNSTAICYDKCIENRVEEEEYPDSCRRREAPAGERSSGTPENTPRSGFPERTGQ